MPHDTRTAVIRNVRFQFLTRAPIVEGRMSTESKGTLTFRILPFFRRKVFNRGRERRMSGCINGPVFDFCAGRVVAQKVIAFPVLGWADGPGNKAATAIWTDVVQHMVNAGSTERTFIRADACLQ